MIKVLVVDDNLIELEIVKQALETNHFECLTVSDPTKAVFTAVQYQPDIIILDLMMPGRSGFDLCRDLKINPSTKHISIMLLTADNRTESIIKGVHLGVVDYIHKPISPDELVQAIIAQNAAKELGAILEPMQKTSDDLKTKYERPRAKKMTLFFGAGTSWRSRIIQFITGSRWSHVAVVEGSEAIEAAGGAQVRVTPVGFLQTKYRDHEFRSIPGDATKAKELIGRDYDSKGILAFIFKWVRQDQEKWFCSELVAHASDLFSDDIAHKITPEDLYRVSKPVRL